MESSNMKIVTLTLNPSLDKSTSLKNLQPDKKLRCDFPFWEPGGGGINVSRAIKILKGESLAIYAAGGPTGQKIQLLLNKAGVDQHPIHVRNQTRENLTVIEKSTGNQYRFGMPGSRLRKEEISECITIIENLPADVEYLVASGSLPPGAPDDFYGKIARIARNKNIKFILDTSGNALINAAGEGIYLTKPNLRELSQLAGKEKISGMEQEEIARKIISEGTSEILLVSLGPRGAMVTTKDKTEYVMPPTVKTDSTIGAGDSMVAGFVLSMSRGNSLRDSVKWGVAAGTAATITPGTELCRLDDVEAIFDWLNEKEK
jgi:6-phosphofructokinase 2